MRSRRFALLVHLVLLAGGVVMAFPFYWMLATSFKSPQEALQARPIWLPERMKPQNWLKAARLGDSPLLGGLGPGRSVELFFPAPEGKPPRALVPRTPGAFTDPRAEGTRVEVAYREGGYVVRLTNTTKGAFSLLPLVVLWPKEVPLQPPLPPDALRSQGEDWRLEWVNAVPGALGYVFHNYLEAWRAAPWGRYFFNSFFTAFTQVAVGLFLASLAAFALARIPFPGKEGVFVLILATMMVPGEVLLIPNYVLLARLGWLDTYYALIVPWLASVFGIFLLRQFYLSLPQDLFDAARIDGAGYLTQLFRIALPLSLPRPGVLRHLHLPGGLQRPALAPDRDPEPGDAHRPAGPAGLRFRGRLGLRGPDGRQHLRDPAGDPGLLRGPAPVHPGHRPLRPQVRLTAF